MMLWVRIVTLVFIALASTTLSAEVRAVYEFESREQEMRFQTLIGELRCPKCQNQNIADSNAPISKDMRDAVYRMMSDGDSDEEITGALVSRFGEFVRYRTEVERRTLLLWATPVLVVLIGIVVITISVRRSSRAVKEAVPLTDEERERATRLLGERGGNSHSS